MPGIDRIRPLLPG